MARNWRGKTWFLPLSFNRPLFCHKFQLEFVLEKYLELKMSFRSVRMDSEASSQSLDSGPRVQDLSQVSRNCPFRYCTLRFPICVVAFDRCKPFDSNAFHRIRPIPEQRSTLWPNSSLKILGGQSPAAWQITQMFCRTLALQRALQRIGSSFPCLAS